MSTRSVVSDTVILGDFDFMLCLSLRLMPMTHLPEIVANNRFLAHVSCSLVPNFSGISLWQRIGYALFSYWFMVPVPNTTKRGQNIHREH